MTGAHKSIIERMMSLPKILWQDEYNRSRRKVFLVWLIWN